MVQKVPDKLGIQADRSKTNVQLAKPRPKPCLQHLEIKSRGAELRKKMKKSGSTLLSPRQVPQPRKPPPLLVPITTASRPQKQSPVKALNTTPNYMKSTTSFNARKESPPQVSSRRPQAISDCKLPSTKNLNGSKVSSLSAHKPPKTSSLKLVRTLTKTPSFKPARASSRKSPPVILCENLDIQRATCSSTLKDSKFPDYLTLNPGGTELDGTSVMKVCPYTYCSLNGHHHPPLPPLKYFLSARRRMLKTQRSIKLGCLSPRRARPKRDGVEEFEVLQVDLDYNTQDQEDSNRSITQVTQEENIDFFIEIYGKEEEGGAHVINSGEDADHRQAKYYSESAPNPSSQSGTQPAAEERGQDAECLPTKPNHMGVESNEDLKRKENVVFKAMVTAELFAQQITTSEAAEEINVPPLGQESTGSIQPEKPESTASDMDWEVEQYSAFYLDDEVDSSIKFNEKSGAGDDLIDVHDVQTPFQDSFVEAVLQQSFDEESILSEAWLTDMESKSTDSYPYFLDEDEGFHVDNGANQSQICGKSLHQISHILHGVQATALWETEDSDYSHDPSVMDQGATFEDPNNSHNSEAYQSAVEAKAHCFSDEAFDGCIPSATEHQEDQDFHELQRPGEEGGSRMKDHFGDPKLVSQVGPLPTEDQDERMPVAVMAESEACQTVALEDLPIQTTAGRADQNPPSFLDHLNSGMHDCEQAELFNLSSVADFSDQSLSGDIAENAQQDVDKTDVNLTTEEKCSASKDGPNTDAKNVGVGYNTFQELSKTYTIQRGMRCKEPNAEMRDEFNPRPPNFLQLVPDPDAEKVDLKHQIMDERKNAEEWMIDYALRQAVYTLAPARKRKVALLVEAFETIMPVTKYEPHQSLSSETFSHIRPMQACS